MVGVLASLEDHLGYASDSVATGRVSHAGQTKCERPDKEAIQKRTSNGLEDDELTPNGEEGGRDYLNG